MRARLVQIGRSRAIILPKAVIAAAGLIDEVELDVHNRSLVIRPTVAARRGWAVAAEALAASRESGLLDPVTPSRFEMAEWTW